MQKLDWLFYIFTHRYLSAGQSTLKYSVERLVIVMDVTVPFLNTENRELIVLDLLNMGLLAIDLELKARTESWVTTSLK